MTMAFPRRNFISDVRASGKSSCLLIYMLKTATDGGPDSARFIGFCAHCTCRSTMPARQLSADNWKRTVATWLSRFEFTRLSCLRSDDRSFLCSRLHSVASLIIDGRRLSVPCLTLSREWKSVANWRKEATFSNSNLPLTGLGLTTNTCKVFQKCIKTHNRNILPTATMQGEWVNWV